MGENPRLRVLAIASHPVQYAVPIFRRMSQDPRLDFHVAYCTLRGADAAHDLEFGTTVKWDVPLLDGYVWTEVKNKGSGGESFFGLCNPGIWKLIRSGEFDAVLCYTGYLRASFWIAYLAAKFSGTAFLFGTDATSLTPRDGRSWKIHIKKLLWPSLFRLADQVVVTSSAGVKMMRELAIPPDKISLTPFVVDNDWWSEQSRRTDRNATRTEWGVSDGELVVLFCAKLQPWKRPLDLLRAFAKADVPGSVLIFVGEGPLRCQIESEAVGLGIARRVRMLGFTNQSRLPAVYSAADLFVIPSSYDPCPVVVCEAMLCGLPVILSEEIRGRADLVLPGITGDIFPCGDIDALAGSLKRFLSNRARLAAVSAACRVRMETWSPHENVAATVDAIARAVHSRHGLPPSSASDPTVKSAFTTHKEANR
jgi:glycosyltransferase involved in cell wall biosynthesis